MDKERIGHKAFKLIKENKNISVERLCGLIAEKEEQYDLVIFNLNKLTENYGLIILHGEILSLTEKGEKFKNLDLYFESLKKESLSKYQKIYLTVFFIPVLFSVIFGCLNYNLNSKNTYLKSQNEILNAEFLIYKDSVVLLRSRIELHKKNTINDTSKTKN